MKLIQTIRSRILPAALAGVLLSGCFLTDPLGLRPLQGVPAAEVRQRLQNEASVGFALGCNYYLARKSGLSFDCQDLGAFRSATALAYLLAPTFAGLDEDGYYQAPSVENCADRVFDNAFLYSYFFLQSVEKSSNRPDLKLPSSDDDYRGAAVFAAYGAEGCGLQKTGQLVELTDPVSI